MRFFFGQVEYFYGTMERLLVHPIFDEYQSTVYFSLSLPHANKSVVVSGNCWWERLTEVKSGCDRLRKLVSAAGGSGWWRLFAVASGGSL